MAIGELLSGLIGAVLGALLGAKVALVVAQRQIRASQMLQRRDELRELVAQFWGACDGLWEAKQDLAWTIVEMQAQRQAGGSLGDVHETRRQQAFALITSSEHEIRRSIALMRLLFAHLEESAEALAEKSRQFRPRPDAGDMGEEFTSARAAALNTFERVVRREVDLAS